MDPNRVIIFDTTLRDGEQSPGCTMNIAEKLEIAHALARLGVDVIEAGFPVSSPGDFEAVKRIAEEVKGPIICGLARAIPKDIQACGEALYLASKYGRGRIHTFIATSPVHMEKKLKMTPDQVVERAVAAVRQARGYTDNVEFSCEDAGRSDPDFLERIVSAVIEAGATTINLPDTTGYCQPEEMKFKFLLINEMISGKLTEEDDRRYRDIVLSCHCHDDLGNAVANSLAALAVGCRQVECTINGIGERAGNASLEEIVMNLKVRQDYYRLATGIETKQLGAISRLVSNITGHRVQRNKAIVGANAFAHEAGIHQDGVLKERTTYEIMTAAEVGWTGDSLVLGKHSGLAGLKAKLGSLGFVNLAESEYQRIYSEVMKRCDHQKMIHDDELLEIANRGQSVKPELFVLEKLQATTDGDGGAVAAIFLRRNGEVLSGSGLGVGPVHAAVNAFIAATGIPIELKSYDAEAVGEGAETTARVSVTLEALGGRAVGRAADPDVVKAPMKAVLTAMNRIIAHENLDRPPQETV